MVREYTNKILTALDEGTLDKDILIRDLLNFMSEDDVHDFYDCLMDSIDEGYEDDGQPSELDEWLDFDPDC